MNRPFARKYLSKDKRFFKVKVFSMRPGLGKFTTTHPYQFYTSDEAENFMQRVLAEEKELHNRVFSRDGRVFNGFDYNLQVWVVDGVVQNVGAGRHGVFSENVSSPFARTSFRVSLAGRFIGEVQGAEVRAGE